MEFFLENIIYIAVFITIVSFVFFYLRRSDHQELLPKNQHKELSKNEIEIKLRAYERLTLFLERIEPVGMINRLELHNEKIDQVPLILIKNIVIEYEYNISQQIYVSDGLWKILELIKNKMINSISHCASSIAKNSNTDDLVKKLLEKSNENMLLIKRAQKILKEEISYISQPR
tara:strand:+ start:384 stop:905 length:522 start_codon:yes stop_codon:yes gene_type:complete